MLSGDDIGDSGEIKGVVLWLLDRLSSRQMTGVRALI
jgi:hypothetical protein